MAHENELGKTIEAKGESVGKSGREKEGTGSVGFFFKGTKEKNAGSSKSP